MLLAIISLLVFIFGLIVGSFLNVVIFRLNTGRSVAKGRSRCSSCDRTLFWYELIPLLSFIGLRGKCRTCRAQLSFQYPFVELLTGFVFFLIFVRSVQVFGLSSVGALFFVIGLILSAMLIVITVYDIRHQIIPNKVVYPFIILSFLTALFSILFLKTGTLDMLLGGPALALPFFLIWFLSHGKGMGFGDVKLALGMGWLVGLSGVFSVFLISFWIGAVVGLVLIAFGKRYTMMSAIPFGPFLVLALALVLLGNISLNSLFLL